MVTGSWVHAIKDKEYVRREFQYTKDAKSLSALRWDGGELRQLASSLDKKYDDAFTILTVSSDFVRTAHTAAGSVPFILNLIREVNMSHLQFLTFLHKFSIFTQITRRKIFR